MKKMILFLLFNCLIAQLFGQHITGNGTVENPYRLYNASDVDSIRYLGNYKYYRLANNIDMSSININEISYFSGQLDGNNCTLSNMTVNGNALFPEMQGSGTGIKNLYIKHALVNRTGSTKWVAILGWTSNGTSTSAIFDNIHIDSSTVIVNSSYNHDFRLQAIMFSFIDDNDSLVNCSVTNSVCSLTVSNQSGNNINIGALIGHSVRNTKIYQSYTYNNTLYFKATSGITQYARLAGFIAVVSGGASVQRSTIKNCFCLKTTYINDGISDIIASGFFDRTDAAVAQLINCYSADNIVIGNSTNSSAFANSNTVNLSTCYADIETSTFSAVQLTGTGTPANGKTTVEMKTQSTYQSWDFENVWGIRSDFNNGYPYLRSVQTPPTAPVVTKEWLKVYFWRKTN